MNKGDWVIHNDGRVGRVTIANFHKGYHLVDFENEAFAWVTNHTYITPLAPAVLDILTAVKQHESE